MQITDKERRVSTITMEQPWEPGPFFCGEVGANLVRVVIGHSGVKTIVFLHKKSAIRTFVGDCCSETSGGRGEVPGQTIGDIHTDVLSTQHYSAPSPSSRPICHRETSHPHKQTWRRCLTRFRMEYSEKAGTTRSIESLPLILLSNCYRLCPRWTIFIESSVSIVL